MADSKLRVNLIGDASSLNRSLQIATARMDAFGKKATQIGKDLSLRLTLPIGLAAGAAIKMAASMEESLNKVDVSFGESSKMVRDFAKTSMRSFGIAEAQALDMAGTFGDMATGFGISRDEAAKLAISLVGLSGDIQSFKDVNIEEVTTALTGVFNGETESLKRLGIVMTENTLNHYLLDQGINRTFKSLTEQEKILVRTQFIFKQTANAQGDYARTADSASNQIRELGNGIKEVATELGGLFLDNVTDAIKQINGLIAEFRGLDDETKKTIVTITLVVAAIPPLIYALGQLAISFSALSTAIMKIPTAVKSFTSALGLGLVAIDQITKRIAPALDMLERFGIVLQFIGQPHMIAPMLKLRDGIKEVEEAQKALNEETEKTAEAPPAATTIAAPVFKETVDPELLALNEMANQADATAAALDEMMRTDPTLQFALAKDAAALDNFANAVADTAERVRTPMDEVTSKVQEMGLNIASVAEQMGSALFAAIANGGNAMAALGQVLLGAIGDILIQMGTAAIAASNLAKTFAIPIVGAAAGIAAIALGTMIKGMSSKIQGDGFAKFANGGIVSAPTLGLMGEYMGARSNPEVIAPLDRLQSLMGMGSQNVNVTGQFRLDGQDLVVAVERASNQRSNFIG
jgi:hypothetical protein